MNVVLVSQRLVGNKEYPEVREALDIRWGDFLKACGILPVPVASHIPAKDYFDQINPRGVLLTGGNDLAAMAPHDPLSRQRDETERALIELAQKHNCPMIGVCRGMQMIAHHHGFSLQKKEGHVTPSHRVQLEAGTRLKKIYGKDSLDVNSYHHFCVTQIKGDFEASARLAADETIEAFEHRVRDIYGLMWHPERMDPFSPLDIAFFKKVFSS